MYLALRDLRFAKGRFVLMGGVVALITLLLVLLSGLTAGLGNQSTSALAALPADQIVFGAPAGDSAKASFTESEVTRRQLSDWAGREGVAHAELLGISQSRFQAIGPAGTPSGTASVAVFGTEAPRFPGGRTRARSRGRGNSGDRHQLRPGTRTADRQPGHGGRHRTDRVGRGPGPVVLPYRRCLDHPQRLAEAGPHHRHEAAATVIAVTAEDEEPLDVEAANAAAGTVSTTRDGSFQALGSYRSENGSLLLMQAFLYGISALVIVAFLTVWTVQRTRDVAVLKALGGSSGYILKDAMAQAAIVLLAGAVPGVPPVWPAESSHPGRPVPADPADHAAADRGHRRPRSCRGRAGRPQHHAGGSAPGARRQLAPSAPHRHSPKGIPMKTALNLVNVTLEYPDGDGSLKALDAVNLRLDPGEFLSLVGPSGSGKSSLLAVAATLVRPTAGLVMIGGIDAGGLSEAERTSLRRDRIGIIFQQPNLLPSLTALEQLVIGDHLRGKPAREAARRAAALLDLVGLAPVAGKRPHQLSGGQRQRVNIARALMGDPAVLLVDEPTAALDQERSEAIVRLLRRVTDEFGVATVMVTHDTGFVPLTDTVASMLDGRLSTLQPVSPALA